MNVEFQVQLEGGADMRKYTRIIWGSKLRDVRINIRIFFHAYFYRHERGR